MNAERQRLTENQLKKPETRIEKVMTTLIDWVEQKYATHSRCGNLPIYDSSLFPWTAEVEKEWKTIRAEVDQLLTRRDELMSFHEVTDEVATITTDDEWKTFFLIGYGVKSKENCKRCPETLRILKKIPGLKTAMFSILSPGKHIPAHRGPYNGVLRYHLGLKTPESVEKCRIRVHDQYYSWREGEGIVFDDTFNHEVWNDTDGVRVVLFVDFERPIHFPINLINKGVLRAVPLSPAIRQAKKSQKEWAKKFYGTDGVNSTEQSNPKKKES